MLTNGRTRLLTFLATTLTITTLLLPSATGTQNVRPITEWPVRTDTAARGPATINANAPSQLISDTWKPVEVAPKYFQAGKAGSRRNGTRTGMVRLTGEVPSALADAKKVTNG